MKNKSSLFALFLVSVLSVFLIILGITPLTQADVTDTAQIIASEGTWVDPAFGTSNFNNQLLFLNGDGFGGTAKVTLLKFDVSSVSFIVNRARLNMSVVDDGLCGVSDLNHSIDLHEVTDDSWSEGTLTFNTLPAQGSFIATIDSTPYVTRTYWTDNGGGNLSTFVEAQRSANGGNDLVSIWVQTTTSFSDGIFEDDEGNGAGFGCNGANLEPTLQLADTDPLAVNLTDAAATTTNSWLLWSGIILLLASFSGFFFYRRQNVMG